MDDRNDIICVVLQSGNRLCALPSGHVIETMRPLPVRPLQGAAAFVQGAAVIRGEPVPVLDLSQLLTGQPQAAATTRFVTVRAGARRVALAVEAVAGVQRLPVQACHALPPLLHGMHADAVAALGVLDNELVTVLDAMRLLPEGALPPAQSRPAEALP